MMLNRGIYFIFAAEVNRIKIGQTTNVNMRLSSLQSASPCNLSLIAVIPGDHESESRLHERFAHDHFKGEWFVYSPRLRAYLIAEAQMKTLDRSHVAFLEMMLKMGNEEFHDAITNISYEFGRSPDIIIAEYEKLSTVK